MNYWPPTFRVRRQLYAICANIQAFYDILRQVQANLPGTEAIYTGQQPAVFGRLASGKRRKDAGWISQAQEKMPVTRLCLQQRIDWLTNLGMLLLLVVPIAGFAVEDDKHACALVLGDWSGIYRWDGSSYAMDDYRFDSAYDEDGSVIIDFVFLQSGAEDRHEGFWTCEQGVLTTGLLTDSGENVLFQYKILEISPQHWVYQLISPFPNAPVFHAERAGSRRMSPEIFDRLLPEFHSN